MAQDGKAPPARAVPAKPTNESNGLGYERVREVQRRRILAAMSEVAYERGVADVSVAHVVERAGVSRRTFYEFFEDREDCFLTALDEAVEMACHYVLDCDDPAAEWVWRIRSALEALLRFAEDQPGSARLAVVESLSAGIKAREVRLGLVAQMVAAVDAGRAGVGDDLPVTGLTAEGVVGGVSSVIHDQLISDVPPRFVELANPLMSMIVLPYRGPAAARRELERPAGKIPLRGPATPANPLKGLDMRLTYRTVRVLAAVGAYSGGSNRIIGEAAGVGDQGQISKLLRRLRRLGLVANGRADVSKGAPNAWILTERGEEVANVIAPRGTPS